MLALAGWPGYNQAMDDDAFQRLEGNHPIVSGMLRIIVIGVIIAALGAVAIFFCWVMLGSPIAN